MEPKRQLDFVFLQHDTDTWSDLVNTKEGKEGDVVTFVQVKADRVKAELVQQLDRSGILAVGRR
ncbi:hypothetical protein [Azospirillum argentinense]|uniref:hypothetical protein n=1 Tax=Azospirillum argentinense TaxID=2970906 RepID=UPI0010C05908|nr:hypothetical protein [Azospirillum argentinense]